MIAGISFETLTLLAIALLIGGAVAGVLAGLFGIGGGGIMVPVLYEVFGIAGVTEEVRMPLAVGTSLAVMVPTAIASFRRHLSTGAVDRDVLRIWVVPVVLGVLAGIVIARYSPPHVFKAVFAVVASFLSLRLLFGRDSWRVAMELPRAHVTRIYGGVIGVLSTLMGIGGGQLGTFFLMLYGRPIHQAVATSSGLGVIISIPAALGYVYAGWPNMRDLPPLSVGYVSLIAFALMIPTSTLLAPVGAHIAHHLSKRWLEFGLGIFLLAVSARFIVSLF